eukprot:c32630_g1_i1 orf=1-192(-)
MVPYKMKHNSQNFKRGAINNATQSSKISTKEHWIYQPMKEPRKILTVKNFLWRLARLPALDQLS